MIETRPLVDRKDQEIAAGDFSRSVKQLRQQEMTQEDNVPFPLTGDNSGCED